MKRVIDIFLGCLSALALLVLLLAIAVRLTPKVPALYGSDRVGRNNVILQMPKFRSMRTGMPVVDAHLLADAWSHLSPNRGEMRQVVDPWKDAVLHRKADALRVNLGLQALLLTRFEEGTSPFQSCRVGYVRAHVSEMADVTSAGGP